MKNKNILVITPFFAPETHAAVFRAHKLVKYLKKEGWNPIVLTVDTNYIYNENPELLKELKDIEIVRTRYIEPSVRGLKMWLTGKDLTYKTLKQKGFYNVDTFSRSTEKSIVKKEGFLTKIYNYLLDNHLNSPDRFWTWKYSAIKEAKRLIKKYDINLVYTSSSPYTTLEIGFCIKSDFPNIKWVADYRDPLTYTLRNHSAISSVFKKQKKIEIKALDIADAITGLSSSYKLIYHDLYNGKYDYKMFFVPTGLDDELIPLKDDIDQSNEIIYVGEYLPNYGTTFFDYYGVFQSKYPQLADKVSFTMIGSKDINIKALKKLNINEDLFSRINFVDHIPQVELYKKIQRAKAVLLSPGYNSHWWTNFAKMVDYIALEKQVLAIIPNPSEARTELIKSGLGLFMDSEERAVHFFKELATHNIHLNNVNQQYCKKYLASSQVQSFIEIFEKL